MGLQTAGWWSSYESEELGRGLGDRPRAAHDEREAGGEAERTRARIVRGLRVAEERMKLGITGPAGKAYRADTQTASVGGYCANQ